jgi:hypothetical protein
MYFQLRGLLAFGCFLTAVAGSAGRSDTLVSVRLQRGDPRRF